MAVLNSENVRAAVWIALKRLDLNGWSDLYNNLCELHIVKQRSARVASWDCHGNVNRFAVASLSSAFLWTNILNYWKVISFEFVATVLKSVVMDREQQVHLTAQGSCWYCFDYFLTVFADMQITCKCKICVMSADISSSFADNRVLALREIHIPSGAQVTSIRQVRFWLVYGFDVEIYYRLWVY